MEYNANAVKAGVGLMASIGLGLGLLLFFLIDELNVDNQEEFGDTIGLVIGVAGTVLAIMFCPIVASIVGAIISKDFDDENDDITESDIAELCKSKPEKIQAYFSAWELEKECGVFSVAKGKKIKEVEGYRIWENKSSVILSWKLPKSKKDLFRVLEMSEWKDSDISFDELDGPDSSKGYGSTNYNSKGKELSSVEDFDGYGDTNSDFGSDYYSTEITILFKGKKSVKFSESSKAWSVGLSGGEQKTLKDYDAVVAVIKKIIK